jgi:hypothetical protein
VLPSLFDRRDGLTDVMMEYVIRNRVVLFRSVTIIYVFYLYLIGTEVMPNLTIIAAVSLYAHFLCKRLTILITTTFLFSNWVRYLTNY